MTVELKEFVERSLKDVLKAVHDAGEDPQIGKQVAPWGIGGAKFPETSGAVPVHNGSLTFVKFDIAVTAESADTTKGGGGFKVAVLSIGVSAGGEAASIEKNTAVTRIQFAVPVLLPAGDRIRPPPDGAA
jgi:hypothetical protein